MMWKWWAYSMGIIEIGIQWMGHFYGLVQDCNTSSALEMKLLQCYIML